PARFHHMLRVWKPRSPMNLGAWTLTAYSGAVSLAVLREWLRGERTDEERSLAGRVTDGVLVAVTDLAGVPLALLLAGYTGVLLSSNATPVWSQNPWIGPDFSAGAMASGATATSLALEAFHAWRGTAAPPGPQETLEKISTVSHIIEGAMLAGVALWDGRLAKPLVAGPMSPWVWGAGGGLLGSIACGLLAGRGKKGRWARTLSPVLGLASGFAIRWALVHAGRHSADDPNAARQAHRSSPSAKGH
ncbi:MAG TPA: NrfD/PsrC family molybdoenzyme membrane anchor subunit, partial [Gemmataceae bacterium]|nr:NrfD/PsrC family molybdoenzyme membrane anchor subunit [Gemmataceae bacterium]